MHHRRRDSLSRLVRAGVGCLLGGAMMVPLGPTTTSQAVNQMNATSMRGVPSTPSMAGGRDTAIWVPARIVRVPGEGTVLVPAHWERRLDARDVYVPSLMVRNPATGVTETVPAGIRPPADERIGP
jgi:hypothetical protein